MSQRTTYRKLAIGWLLGLLFVAVFADFLANDRPLIAKVDDEIRFPVLHDYGRSLGLVDGYQPLVRNWSRVKTVWAIWPPVPFSAGASDIRNSNFKSPFDAQETGDRARHYLGTDALGRDVLAGLINGARVAIVVGLGSVLLTLLIGVPLGGVAGFFGNESLRGPRYHWWGWTVGGTLGVIYAFVCLFPFFGEIGGAAQFLLVVTAFAAFGLLLRLALRLIPPMRNLMAFPADTLILQGIELFVNIPGLVLLIALLAIIDRPSIWIVVLVIGVLGWPTIARYLRAELLRIRQLPYIEAAKVSGIGRWRTLFYHALPNALGPLLVISCFGIGSAILLEALLSFLGVGIPSDQVTWGTLLRYSQSQPTAWWLAVFPGLLLTGTVLAANGLSERR